MAGRHYPREKGRSASAQDGAGLCTTPMPQPLMQPSHALPTNLLRNRTHFLGHRNHNTGGKHVAGRHNPREKGRSASAQDGAGLCTTPMPQPLMQPSHALPTNLLRNRTHLLWQRNHNTGEKQVAGRHNPREKRRSASAQDGAGLCTTPMPQPLMQPLHALPKNLLRNRTHSL